jgi:hypothetical protein
MLTFLVAGILLLMVLNLLARIPLVREFGSGLFMTVGLLWIIGNHGGDTHFWAPWVFGLCMTMALIGWLYTLFGLKK